MLGEVTESPNVLTIIHHLLSVFLTSVDSQ